MMAKPLESDWKIYSKNVPEWRERYLTQKNGEIIAVLSDREKTHTERFWDAKRVMEDESRILRDCLDPHSRSNMVLSLCLMIRYKMVEESDLDDFSEVLRERLLSAGS